MRKAQAVFAVVLIAVAAWGEPLILTPDCIAPGCVIVLKQRAQFIENRRTCEREYIPGKANYGHVTIRGRDERFTVLRIEDRDGEDVVIAENSYFFEKEVHVFSFARVYLENSRAFSIEK